MVNINCYMNDLICLFECREQRTIEILNFTDNQCLFKPMYRKSEEKQNLVNVFAKKNNGKSNIRAA